jgi:excisionase family DNA binding protein
MKEVESIVCGNFEIAGNYFYSTAELAKIMQVAPKTINKLIKKKEFTAKKPGRHYRISGLSVIRYFQSCEKNLKQNKEN